jgi:hypothetical protein
VALVATDKDGYMVKFTTTISPKAMVALKKRSEKTEVPMARIINRLILDAEKAGWK